MRMTVRFNWQYDLDLIALAMHPDFDMAEWMRRVVFAYVREDQEFYVPVPDPVPYDRVLDSCELRVYISDSLDGDVAECMRGIRYGHRCSFLKNLFRSFMDRPYFWPYLTEYEYSVRSRGKEAPVASKLHSGKMRLSGSITKKDRGRPSGRGTDGERVSREGKKNNTRKKTSVKPAGAGRDAESRMAAGAPRNQHRADVPRNPAETHGKADTARKNTGKTGESPVNGNPGESVFPEGFDLGAAIDAL